jgi:hypothetical protein
VKQARHWKIVFRSPEGRRCEIGPYTKKRGSVAVADDSMVPWFKTESKSCENPVILAQHYTRKSRFMC